MTDDLVNAAREALVGVTEGPWRTDQDKSPSDVYCNFGSSRWPTRTLTECDTNYFDGNANARFIAAARSLVPAMADRIAELEAELAMARDAISATSAQKRKRIVTNFDFKRLLPIVLPFAIYGYLRLFFAVVGIGLESEYDVTLACFSLAVGFLGGVFATIEMDAKGVEWRWLARKDNSDD